MKLWLLCLYGLLPSLLGSFFVMSRMRAYDDAQ